MFKKLHSVGFIFTVLVYICNLVLLIRPCHGQNVIQSNNLFSRYIVQSRPFDSNVINLKLSFSKKTL